MSSRFPYGLLKAGSVVDEIDLNLGQTISRVERLAYSAANLATAKNSGREYEYDEDYIYLARASAVVNNITIDGSFTVNDHGIEFFTQTPVEVVAELLYGNNLKNKLEHDVLIVGQQTLSATQKSQVRTNIGAATDSDVTTLKNRFSSSKLKIANGGTGAATAEAALTALGAQAALSVETTNATGKGLTIYLCRYGKVVSFSIPAQPLSAAVTANSTVILTVPSGWRPLSAYDVSGAHGSWDTLKVFEIKTNGELICKSNLTSGSSTGGCSGCYICS